MKRILQFISCLVIMFFALNLHSQQDLTSSSDYGDQFLKEYRPPNFTFTSWRLSPNIRESGTDASSLKRSLFNLRVVNDIYFNQQRDKSNTEITVFFINELRSAKVNDVKNGNDNFYNNNTSINGFRDFFIKDKFFLSAGLGERFVFNRELIDDWRSNSSNQIFANLGLGLGRVFEVTNAWQAQTIFNDLECNGIAVDRSYMKDLADLLTVQRNTRIFDTRLARIKFQTALYNFMQDNGVADFNPFTAAVINDSYSFETFRTRKSGFTQYQNSFDWGRSNGKRYC